MSAQIPAWHYLLSFSPASCLQSLIDFLLCVFRSQGIAFRRSACYTLVPEPPYPGTAVGIPKIRMCIINARIYTRYQNSFPCQCFPQRRKTTLHCRHTGRTFPLIDSKKKPFRLFHIFYAGKSGKTFDFTLCKSNHGEAI